MQPLFISSPCGPLFGIYFAPENRPNDRAILHIPAFAEEMNKSRHMLSLQARNFAQAGYAVLVLDLYGTGESAGDFGAATWEIWLENLHSACNWLIQQGAQTIDLWGLRTGCLLAMDFAEQNPETIRRLLCWQPVVNGETFITQFLRLRIAAAMMDNNTRREKTSDLKHLLLSGQAIEVAGYTLNPGLANPLISLRADRLHRLSNKEIAIFEVVSTAETAASLVNTNLLTGLQEKNIDSSLTTVVGDFFWANQEISTAPALISASREKIVTWL
jgi:exosortase A-associated hydrolase 2